MTLPNRPVLLVVLALALAFGLLVAAWSPHTAAAQASTKQLDVHAVNAPAGASWSISSNAGFGDQTFSFSQSVQVAPGTYTITWHTAAGCTVTPDSATHYFGDAPFTVSGASMTLTLVTGTGGYTVSATYTCPQAGDTTPPVVTVPGSTTLEATGPGGATATFSASATDANPASPTVTCTPASGSTFALGATAVTCSATDAAGNTGSKSFTVTVQDTTAPALTVPGPLTANATGPAGAAVTFTASATDAVTSAPTITCTASGATTGAVSSGATFAIGTTTVSCTAKDAANNTSAAQTFAVTVTAKSAAAQVTDLQAKVQALPLDPPTRNNLTSILQNAQAAIGRGDIAGACDKLSSFINQVQAQSGKSIVKATADGLITDATRIKAVIGCA